MNYKVASPHFDKNNQENIGTYNLSIRSDVARCLYGYSNAPISATISVVSTTGEEQIAVTSVSEKDNWLRLSASGFKFSSPVLKVKITQDSQLTTSNSNKNSLMPASPKPITNSAKALPRTNVVQKQITCKKGKSLKKVTGSQPDCPRGYVKIATKNLGITSKAGVKTIWCLKDNEAFEVAGKNPQCPDGFART